MRYPATPARWNSSRTRTVGGNEGAVYAMLDLVALATIADIAPLRGENRVFVRYGLKLINENPRPTADEVKHYMRGNICRCTGYKRILEAILDASRRMSGASAGNGR